MQVGLGVGRTRGAGGTTTPKYPTTPKAVFVGGHPQQLVAAVGVMVRGGTSRCVMYTPGSAVGPLSSHILKQRQCSPPLSTPPTGLEGCIAGDGTHGTPLRCSSSLWVRSTGTWLSPNTARNGQKGGPAVRAPFPALPANLRLELCPPGVRDLGGGGVVGPVDRQPLTGAGRVRRGPRRSAGPGPGETLSRAHGIWGSAAAPGHSPGTPLGARTRSAPGGGRGGGPRGTRGWGEG